jgi:maltose alpha-D-glucosyltransferase/alpha-amylase
MATLPDHLVGLEDDPLWYKDAIIYEVHVSTFYDSDGDGIGDFSGLTQKLDYLQNLGVTVLWLLPFYPSPLKDDGYDISDYTGIRAAYGTMRDFKMFLREAHHRGFRVVTELVLNHTSDQHAWFQRARRAKPGSRWREFYVWSDTPQKCRDARIIFKDFEPSNWTWDPVAEAYYWHRFYAHQPDLNYDHPDVRRAMLGVVDFWLKLGVDGLRLDAVPYLYEREGTSCENLPETHAFLKELRRHVDNRFQNRMLLAEANQWPEDAIAYFGEGDECHMAFQFPLMPRLFMAIQREDRFPIIDIARQTPVIPERCQWALFLRNHDELTLEMVTDEDRDYMYRLFALDPQTRVNLGIRRRLAPLLGSDRRNIELMNSLLFSLAGTPVLYYGDEIGMGDNVYLGDRNGVRTPMQWSADRNAGFSRANPQRLYLPVITDPEYRYEAVNVEAQQNNSNSLLWWMKRLISFRKRHKVFGRGSLEFLESDNRKVLSFLRRHEDERVLVVTNFSRFAQCVELDLSEFKGTVPLELFGQTRFPPVGEGPYSLTLGPHTFYWFALPRQRTKTVGDLTRPTSVPALTVRSTWENLFRGRDKAALEAILPSYLSGRRWFAGKARTIQAAEIGEAIPVPHDSPVAHILLVRATYAESEPETYVLPVAFAPRAGGPPGAATEAIASVHITGNRLEEEGLLYDAMVDRRFTLALLDLVARGRRLTGPFGEVIASPTRDFRPLLSTAGDFLEPTVLRAEQTNTSVVYGDRFVLKLFRRVETGVNPDLELGRFLSEERNFENIAPVAGALELRRRNSELSTLGVLHGFVPNEGVAWQYALDTLGRYFEAVLTHRGKVPLPAALDTQLLPVVEDDVAREWIGLYLEEARLLGQRTGELHMALASDTSMPDLVPEPASDFSRQAVYQAMLSLANRAFPLLRQQLGQLSQEIREKAQRILELEQQVRDRLRLPRDRKIEAIHIRCHGDYHLGQVLYTGNDFVIIDFEGEPTRPLSVRRLKRSPLRDVAGMLRSFHYASYAALLGQTPGVRPEDFATLEPWARFWYLAVSAAFLKGYLDVVGSTTLLPRTPDELRTLLDAYLLEKAIYEISYELTYRPPWVRIPLTGILDLLASPPSARISTEPAGTGSPV